MEGKFGKKFTMTAEKFTPQSQKFRLSLEFELKFTQGCEFSLEFLGSENENLSANKNHIRSRNENQSR